MSAIEQHRPISAHRCDPAEAVPLRAHLHRTQQHASQHRAAGTDTSPVPEERVSLALGLDRETFSTAYLPALSDQPDGVRTALASLVLTFIESYPTLTLRIARACYASGETSLS
jgi:hypothetical protein